MQVIQFFVPNSLRNFNYIVFNEDTRDGYSVDPFDHELVIEKAKENNVNLVAVINTHYHFDHIKSNKELSHSLNIPILENDCDAFKLGDQELRIIKTPGHTSDHVVFIGSGKKEKFIIAGDTIFNAGVGNCKNGGDPEVLFETISMLDNLLDDETLLYPSHDYLLTNLKFSKQVEVNNQEVEIFKSKRETMDLDHEFITTNMGTERKINPFFRLDSLAKELGTKNRKETFIHLRKLRDNF
jgi:hydroxyacylglutathione hydrolase